MFVEIKSPWMLRILDELPKLEELVLDFLPDDSTCEALRLDGDSLASGCCANLHFLEVGLIFGEPTDALVDMLRSRFRVPSFRALVKDANEGDTLTTDATLQQYLKEGRLSIEVQSFFTPAELSSLWG